MFPRYCFWMRLGPGEKGDTKGKGGMREASLGRMTGVPTIAWVLRVEFQCFEFADIHTMSLLDTTHGICDGCESSRLL